MMKEQKLKENQEENKIYEGKGPDGKLLKKQSVKQS